MKEMMKKIVERLRVRHAQNGGSRRARALTSTPFASTALLLALAFGLAGAAQAETYVAEVAKEGVTTQYTSLPAAFDAIGENGEGEVKLLADVDLGLDGAVALPKGADLTLELNGRRITQTTEEGKSPVYLPGAGKLTINDTPGGGGISSVRTATATTNSSLVVFCDGTADLVVNGGTFATTNAMGYAYTFFKCGTGTWTFNGGTVRAVCTSDHFANTIYLGTASGKTFITGGSYYAEGKSGDAYGICANGDSTDTVEVTGGNFDVASQPGGSGFRPGILCQRGTFIFKGGTFNVTSTKNGIACVAAEHSGTVIISNGTFKAQTTGEYGYCTRARAGGQMTIAGGTFDAQSDGGTTATVECEDAGTTLTIVDNPAIHDSVGGWNLYVQVQSGAHLDFTGYTGTSLGSLGVINGDPAWVKGDLEKFTSYRALFHGYYSTRPKDWDTRDGNSPVVNVDSSTKAEYPWTIGKAVAELVPGSGANYTHVGDALTAATAGQAVKLITDVTENISITSSGKTNTLDLAGHVLKGDDTGTAPIILINSEDAAITIRDTSASHTGAITTGGMTYSVDGAGVNVLKGSLSLYDVTITNCVASGNGGAIYQAEKAHLLMSGCTVKGNTAAVSGGGIYKQGGCTGSGTFETCFGKCVLLQTEVVGNTAGTSGGGVYFQKMMELSSCFVAGTRVAMADGTTKAIEEIKEGDLVKTFDHEGGTNSSARVFIWLKEAVTTRAFTLAFAGGSSVTCVLTHDFLMKDGESSCKYVCLGRANAADYVGKLFYGMDGQWHELQSVTDGEEVSEIYELYTAQHFNSYANGMLTVPADVAANLNLYKLDANLKADADQLAADVAKYGYYTYEEAAARGVSRAYYDDAGIKYVNVIVGKGLATWEELEKNFALAQTVAAVGGATALPATTGRALSPLSAALPKLAAAGAEAKIDDFDDGVLTLGANVIVTNNTASGAKGNIYLATANSGADSLIKLTDSHDGICAGVACEWGSGMFTMNLNVAASDVALFTSDNPAYAVQFVPDHLELVGLVTFTPDLVLNTTPAVYANNALVGSGYSEYHIPSNATATVVYTAEAGYVFADGTAAKTNTIDTSVNPATAEAPAAPVLAVAKIVETGVYYTMVQTAFDAAADGQTVQLLTNATENLTLEAADKTNTLDLAGWVLNGMTGEGTNSVVQVVKGGLTVSDSNPTSVHHYKVDTNGVWVWQADFSGTENYTFSIADGLQANGAATDAIPTTNDVIAVKGGAITGGTGTPEGTTTYGGGICVLENGALTVNGGMIVGNRIAGTYVAGGGIYIHGKDGGQYTLTNCALVGNVGGGLSCDYGAYALTSCQTSYNRAGLGGGVYLRENGTAVVKGVKIIGNDATSSVGGSGEALRGGGVYALGALVLSDCVVRGNSASAGGGLDIWKTAAITNCIVANNTAAGSAGGIAVLNAGSITVKGGEIFGNTTIGDGGGMYVSSAELGGSATAGCKATLIDVVLSGNSAANGGAVCQADTSELLMLGCTVTNNTATASGGGICKLGDDYTGTVAGKCVLIETVITGNTSGENGGGVYFRNATCLAAGTRIAMADGTMKAIEDVKEGDFVKTFDHEGGTNSTAQVYLAYKGETKETPFTLWFDDGDAARSEIAPYQTVGADHRAARLSIVGRHDLLLQDTRKYVTITESNVGQYLGAKFYGADGAWHTLTNATMGTTAVEYYSIYTTPDRNVFANGLLTVADDADYLLNLYELDANLKADADRLAADIAKYGLYTYEEAVKRFLGESASSELPEIRALYDALNVKYFNIAVGKQLVSWAYLEKTFETCFSPSSSVSLPTSNVPRLTSLAAVTTGEDVGLKTSDVGGRGATALPATTATTATTGRALSPLSAAATTATTATTGRALSPLSAAAPTMSLAAAPKLAAVAAEPTLEDFDTGMLTLGAGAVITNNFANGAKSNIHLATAVSGADSLIALTDSHDGVCAGVSCSWGVGPFTKNVNVTASDVALFTSDDPMYRVKFVSDHLELTYLDVTFTPATVDHATAAVYVNGTPVEKTGDAYVITSNETAAVVVYTAENGSIFADGTTVKTNAIDTSVNPATAEAPAAPIKAEITDVTARQRYPWNGKVDIAYMATNVLAVAKAKNIDVQLAVKAIDKATTPWTTNVAEETALFLGPLGDRPLPLEEALSNGAHRIVWDMNAQGLSNKSDRVVFIVSAEGKLPEPGLCFTALEDNSTVTIDMKNYNLEYSCDGGQTWEYDNANNGATVTLKTGDKLLVRATSAGNKAVGYYMSEEGDFCYPFKTTGNLKVSGNIMYLLKRDGSQTEITAENTRECLEYGTCGCFTRLFVDCTGITDASELKLANNTYSNCYDHMFSSCTSLTTPPPLPATTMSYNCYAYMFSSCSSLTNVPALPATTLAEACYDSMFAGCSSLVAVDENLLPATSMAEDCYFYMFKNCSALIQAPNLPATDLATDCYRGMFQSCVSLTTAPALGVRKISNNDGQMMALFQGCSKLSSVTLLATEIAEGEGTAALGLWLQNAGTEATNPMLHVVDGMADNASIKNNTPSNWKIAADAE